MNMISASGLPTPKTVWVRELARCAHFVQARTRSRMDARICALFDLVSCNRRCVGDTCASLKDAAKEYADCNCSSAFLDAHGPRSVVSRIFSNVAMTRSRAGWIIVTIIQKFVRRCKSFVEKKAVKTLRRRSRRDHRPQGRC